MNKIDDFYKKKAVLEEVTSKLEHYRLYNINFLERDNTVDLQLRLSSNLYLDKKYLTEIYYKLKRLLEDKSLQDTLERKLIKELEAELEELKNEVKKDFDLWEGWWHEYVGDLGTVPEPGP